MRKASKIVSWLSVIILFLAPLSRAEVIKLKNGRQIEGTILKETDKRIVLDIGGGEATFDKKNIKAVERTKKSDAGTKRKTGLVDRANKINANYYSWLDDNVESINFVFKADSDKAVIEGIKKEDYSDAADRLDNMGLSASYDMQYDRLYVHVVDRPFLEDKKHRDALAAMANADKAALEAFWRACRPYMLKLIDTEHDRVKWIGPEGPNLIIETLNEERIEKKFVFNEKNELVSMEALDGRYKIRTKETPKFEKDGLKYLAKSIETEIQSLEPLKPKEPEKKDGALAYKDPKAPPPELPKPSISKFEITYQDADGVKVPKSVKFSFQNPDPALSLPGGGSIELSNVVIKLKKDAG